MLASIRCRGIAALGVLRSGARREDGQALVEYALLIALVAIIAIGGVEVFGLGVSNLFSKIVSVYP